MAASECSLFSPEYLLKTYLWILELTFLVSKRYFRHRMLYHCRHGPIIESTAGALGLASTLSF